MSQQDTVGRHATTVATVDGETVVTYHRTAVVRFTPKRVILNSGGWRTNTTKARMNQAANQFGLPYTVYQKDFEWYVTPGQYAWEAEPIPFEDGMVIPRAAS